MDDLNPYREAIRRFQELFDQAQRTDLPEPTAFTLATAGPQGPSARTILLKEISEEGFVFYTNTTSRKGQHIHAHAQVAMCFYWQPLSWQVTVEGEAHPVSPDEADAYWESRPRESQIGGWASLQSQVLSKPQTLTQRLAEFEKKFANKKVPRPPHWSGFRVKPHRIEFWKKGEFRLHERTVYQNSNGSWAAGFLFP